MITGFETKLNRENQRFIITDTNKRKISVIVNKKANISIKGNVGCKVKVWFRKNIEDKIAVDGVLEDDFILHKESPITLTDEDGDYIYIENIDEIQIQVENFGSGRFENSCLVKIDY
jgi:hypothetical protein